LDQNQTARRKAHPRNKNQNFILFDAKQQVNALLNVNTVLKWLLIALLIYIATLQDFPWTKGFAATLLAIY
jgi:hypothetical protein